MIQYIYWSRFLVSLDGDVYVYINEKCKFDQPFLSFQAKDIFVGKSFSGVDKCSDSDGNTTLLPMVILFY